MKILVYSLISADSIRQRMGIAEYSYFYVLEEFVPLLKRLGDVIVISDPATEVDRIYQEALSSGEQCLFFSFTTPHSVPNGLSCPTIVVFAWEYDTLPHESWDGESRFDWVGRINATGAAITHSRYTLNAIKRAVDNEVMVESIPAPVWDRMQSLRVSQLLGRPKKQFDIEFVGNFLESRWIDCAELDRFDEIRRRNARESKKAASENGRGAPQSDIEYVPQQESVQLSYSGIIYTALLNPYDGRKNWQVMVEAFCSAFRDVEDVTLLIKVAAGHLIEFSDKMMDYLRRFGPVKCRISLIQGYLVDGQYASLVQGATYYVNTSFCEGQCLPLMEFMSYGVPAIAPRTTALKDYIAPWNAFVLRAHSEPAAWQHDPRQKFRARHYRVEHASLEKAFRRSYVVASRRRWRPLYHLLQIGAILSMRRHCSMKVCFVRLSKYLRHFKYGKAVGVEG